MSTENEPPTQPFCFAVAQSSSVKGDIVQNVRRHVGYASSAATHGANVVVFPELSLTGYEPEIAADVAIDPSDTRLKPLQELSDEQSVTIIAGCPIRSHEPKPHIGAVIIRPRLPIESYRKRFVHADELPWFVASDDIMVCRSHGRDIGIAICFDVSNPTHAADLFEKGATCYVASVAKTPDGVDNAEKQLSHYASSYNMPVAMANHATQTGVFPTGGRSAIWNESGEVIARAPKSGEYMVIAEQVGDHWRGLVASAD